MLCSGCAGNRIHPVPLQVAVGMKKTGVFSTTLGFLQVLHLILLEQNLKQWINSYCSTWLGNVLETGSNLQLTSLEYT